MTVSEAIIKATSRVNDVFTKEFVRQYGFREILTAIYAHGAPRSIRMLEAYLCTEDRREFLTSMPE